MKALYIILICLVAQIGHSQKSIQTSESLNGIDELKIACEWANVSIRNWDGKELKLEGTSFINNGLNDDEFRYTFDRSGSRLILTSDIPNMDELPKFARYKVNGQEFQRKLEKDEKFNWNDLEDMEGVKGVNVGVIVEVDLILYVPEDLTISSDLTYGDLDLDNCQNPMNIKSTYGHVLAIFQDGIPPDCNLTSTYNFVDVSIPRGRDLELSLSTLHGNIYSDLNVKYDKNRSVDQMFNSKIIGSLNKGGSRAVKLRADYGNIYLRGQ